MSWDIWTCPKCGAMNAQGLSECGTCRLARGRQAATVEPTTEQPASSVSSPVRQAKRPNKTEQRYHDAQCPGARYEALTFTLANGHRYTPDWVEVLMSGHIVCHEVKNRGYQHASFGRARMAFDQAALEWPMILFRWAEWDGKAKRWIITRAGE